MSWKSLFVKPTGEGGDSLDTDAGGAGEIDFTKPLGEQRARASGAAPRMSSPTGMTSGPTARVVPAGNVPTPSSTDKSSVDATRQGLLTLAYGVSPALKAFKTQYDALHMLPSDSRNAAALATTATLGFSKEVILKALGDAVNSLETHERDFVASSGQEEREELGNRSARKEQIEQELVRLRQEQAKREEERAGLLAEIEESTRKHSERRAAYEVASKTAVDEVVALRTALTK